MSKPMNESLRNALEERRAKLAKEYLEKRRKLNEKYSVEDTDKYTEERWKVDYEYKREIELLSQRIIALIEESGE